MQGDVIVDQSLVTTGADVNAAGGRFQKMPFGLAGSTSKKDRGAPGGLRETEGQLDLSVRHVGRLAGAAAGVSAEGEFPWKSRAGPK